MAGSISNGIEVSKKIREGQTTDPIVIPLDSLRLIPEVSPFWGEVFHWHDKEVWNLSTPKFAQIKIHHSEMSSCPAPPAKRKLRSERRVFGFLDDFLMRKKWWSSPENGHMELIWV